VASALLYAFNMKLSKFLLRVGQGNIHLMLRHGMHRLFDTSVVSVEGYESLQQVPLSACWRVLLQPVAKPFVLHVHRLAAVGWWLWAADTLSGLIRQPQGRRALYRLDQQSFVRLWRTAQRWDKPAEKRMLLQIVAAACRKVHSIDLRLSLVVRVPFGLQDLHREVAQSIKCMLRTECPAHPAVRQLWLESVRVVQTQGRSVGSALGTFRRWCRELDCSPEGDRTPSFVPKHGVRLPRHADGHVAFRGDDPQLPEWVQAVTRLHVKFIPTQATRPDVAGELAEQLCALRVRVGAPPASVQELTSWLGSLQAATPVDRYHPGSVPVSDVRAVRNVMTGACGHLVGVPIDKNRILFFEDAAVYRRRLIQVFLEDSRHYSVVALPEQQLLREAVADCARLKWDRYCKPARDGHLGYAQCLPKDKDCALNRPIVPNCGHPLARLFNMAARGLAYMLMHVKLDHYNLFTTQEFVSKMAECSQIVADMVSSGEVQEVHIAQSDVKDMYTEISHSEIVSCVDVLLQHWRAQRRPAVLNITKAGRKGVSPGYTCDRRVAASMRVDTVVQIVMYELQHAYFHVGCSHIMQQIIGVSMGSKGGPVLAWCVCMINEHRFHSSLGVDSRYIRVFRYFDDVWQLLMVPAQQAGDDWVSGKVHALEHDCYPASLRLIQNSLGAEADMLSCSTRVAGMELVCVHKSKNGKFLQLGQPARFACFLPYASAHARRRVVMRNSITGLLHRIHMDTQPKDVSLLLPVLLSYDVELSALQYPRHYLLSAFRKFLLHDKVKRDFNSQLWRDLLFSFAHHKSCEAVSEKVESVPVPSHSRPAVRCWTHDCLHVGAAMIHPLLEDYVLPPDVM
jgi:hypothetical protein